MRTCQLIDRLLRKGDPSSREIWRLKAAPTNFKIENPVTGVTGFSDGATSAKLRLDASWEMVNLGINPQTYLEITFF